MEQEHGEKTVPLGDEKSLSPSESSYEDAVEKSQYGNQLSSIQTPHQLASNFAAFSGEHLSQMSLYPPRYYYQYYMPYGGLPSGFGMYGNVPNNDCKSKCANGPLRPQL